MKNHNFILLLLLLTFLAFCTNKKPSYLIANGKYKYWLVIDNCEEKGKAKTVFYIDNKGKWLVFKKYANGTFEKYDGGDVILVQTWKLVDDSTFKMGEKGFHIEKINDTEFVFTDPVNGSTTELRPAPENLVPAEYQKLQ